MSTQSSTLAIASTNATTSLECNLGNSSSSSCRRIRRLTLSNSQLTRAADEAFRYDRQDRELEANRDQVPSNPLRRHADSNNGSYHMNLKKRKCEIDSYSNTTATINTDFLSGIFQDLAEANTSVDQDPDYSCGVPNPLQGLGLRQDLSHSHLVSCASDDPYPSRAPKKVKTVGAFQTRSKSFANSLSFLNAGQTDFSKDHAQDHPSPTSTSTSTPTADHQCAVPHNTSYNCVSDNTAAQIVDQVFGDSITNIQFPTLPATVSASSCSSNNLTQTSVPAAAQVLETQTNASASSYLNNFEGGDSKDSYGWFVDMDEDRVHDRLAEVAAASESCKAKARASVSTDDEDGDALPGLTFSAHIQVAETKKEVELDSEVMWAKAADTVDDVLGEALFF